MPDDPGLEPNKREHFFAFEHCTNSLLLTADLLGVYESDKICTFVKREQLARKLLSIGSRPLFDKARLQVLTEFKELEDELCNIINRANKITRID
jgi:hypothetical protein